MRGCSGGVCGRAVPQGNASHCMTRARGAAWSAARAGSLGRLTLAPLILFLCAPAAAAVDSERPPGAADHAGRADARWDGPACPMGHPLDAGRAATRTYCRRCGRYIYRSGWTYGNGCVGDLAPTTTTVLCPNGHPREVTAGQIQRDGSNAAA